MSDFRYQFKKYKTPSDKETCPCCDHKRKWVRYVDTYTDELLPPQYGKCDRRDSCGHELNPYKDGYIKAIREAERTQRPTDWKPQPVKRTPPPPVFIPNELKKASLKAYHKNNFVKYLHTLFDASDVEQVIERYQIGTSSHWQGSTVFWYIDIQNRVRAGQIKHFDETGHTTKDVKADGEKKNRNTWVHSILEKKQPTQPNQTTINKLDWLGDYLSQESKVSVLFGEQILKQEADKIVCVVEAPKTAIIASLYFPNFVWLAAGALTYLTADRCKALGGRRVILWPDLKALEEWREKANKLSAGRWQVSDFLEQVATDEERSKGLDLADYLTREHYQDFILGYPREWNDRAPVGYVPKLVEHTPQSLGFTKATTPPLTEQDLINLWSTTE